MCKPADHGAMRQMHSWGETSFCHAGMGDLLTASLAAARRASLSGQCGQQAGAGEAELECGRGASSGVLKCSRLKCA